LELKVEKIKIKNKNYKMKKLLSIALAITTVVWLAGSFVAFAPVAHAAIVDGDIVSATTAFADADGNTYASYDVFIVKIMGSKIFKRLILNPQVFTSYGHLSWSNIKHLSATEVAGYTTSSLVRVINEQPVYKLAPNGDVGTKQWVDDIACFTSHNYDWDSVYTINAVDGGNYTTIGSLCGGGGVGGGALTLSLASNSPLSATVPLNAYGVTYMKLNVAGSGTISQLVVKRNGAGSADDFDNVYLYENGRRLVAGRTFSSSTGKASFIGLSIIAPTTIDVVADLSSTSGYQNYFSIESASDVTANTTVNGSFPINGSTITANAVSAGTLAVVVSGTNAYNVTTGTQEAEVGAFKVTATNEATKISRIQLYQGGTVTPSNITDLKLKVAGVTVATAATVGTDGYVTFNLATPLLIARGSSAIFTVYADVNGRPGETVKFYLDLASDILGIGQTYGYGMQLTSGFGSTLVTATLVGGDLTLVKSNSVVASEIGLDTSDTDFLELTMSAAADITISRTRLAWCADINGDGAYADIATDITDIEDTKIVNKDTGVVLAGPQDGSTFVTQTVAGTCPDNKKGLYKDFTDSFDLLAGQSINLKVTADVKSANTSTTALIAGSIIKLVWMSYGTLVTTDGTIGYMKYTGTNNAVKAASIVPSSDIAGEEMTLATPSLVVTLAATPSGTARKFVSGQTGVDSVGFVFTAGSASAMKVTALNLTGYADCDADGTYGLGLEDTSCYVKNLVSSVEIWDTTLNTMVPGSSAKSFTGTKYGTVAYTGLNWTIPAGESRTLLVKSNLSSNIPSTSPDMVSFDIADVTADITAQDKDSNDVSVTLTDAVNGATSPTVAIGIYSFGTVAVVVANDTADQNVLVMGTTNNEVAKYKLTGTTEALNVDTFSVALSTTATARTSDFTGVALRYQTAAQYGTSNWTVSSKRTFGSTATLSFTFAGALRPYIPKDDSSYITALADIQGYNAGAGAGSGDYFKLIAATDANEFKVYGAQSGHLTNLATQPATTGFNYQYIFRSKPFFEKIAWAGDPLELAKFSITAVGYDVTFDGTSSDGMNTYTDSVVSASLEFEVMASGTDATTQTFYLYNSVNAIVSSVSDVLTSNADGVTENDATGITSISFQFEEPTVATVIAQGTTRTFYVMLDNAVDFNNTDEYIYLKLNQNEGDVTANANYDNCSIVWYDGSNDEGITTFEHRICMPANMMNIGAFPFTFRTLTGITP
jgi:hypothetical protein